jgi:hypothetical protein
VSNDMQRRLEDHAEHEILTGARPFLNYLTNMDGEDLARVIHQFMVNVWKGEEGLVRAREIARQWEQDYIQYRAASMSDAEYEAIAEAA